MRNFQGFSEILGKKHQRKSLQKILPKKKLLIDKHHHTSTKTEIHWI